MHLLAVDTSGKSGSIALARCEETGSPQVLEVMALEGGTFSAQLVPQIATVLEHAGLKKNHLDAFVVVTGPGSFTGLRVGLAAVKALAEILQKPVAAVSLLEVMASLAGGSGSVTAALDAGRREIYAGEYEIAGSSSGVPRFIQERLCTEEEFVRGAAMPIVTCDPLVLELARNASLQVLHIRRPNAGDIVLPGWEKLRRNLLASPSDLDANYIRRANAKVL